MKESHKRSRNPKYKPKYRVKNWNQYEQSLRNRGNVTLWLSPKAIISWKSTPSGKRGRQQKYADFAIKNNSENATVIIHPRSNAVISDNKKWIQRDMHVHRIRTDGVYEWRRESGYYRQSKVENTFYRYKTMIGRKLRVRTEQGWEVEAKIVCIILNRFLEQGRAIA